MKKLLCLTGLLISGLCSPLSHAVINSGAVNLPANDKVLFIMGQDTSTLRQYKADVLTNPAHSTMPKPGGVTLYVSVLPKATHTNSAPADATMYVSGIEGPPVDNNNGEVNFAETLGDYDNLANGKKVALAVGLYLSDEWANCGNQPLRAIAGTGDADVGSPTDSSSLSYQWRYAMDRMIKSFKADGRPVYLRIGYEFDGPWNCYNTAFYKSAFSWISIRIKQLGATNVATVWQAATYPDDGDATYGYQVSPNPMQHYADWYPGDAYVDWIAISYFAGSQYLTYQWSCQDASKPWTVPDTSPRLLQNTLVNFARNHGKPAMIAESAPQAFDMLNRTYSCTAGRANTRNFASGQAMWDAFFADYFQWIFDNKDQLRAVAYINTDWQSQSRWYCAPGSPSCASGYWGVTSIQADAQVLANFKTEMNKSFYAQAGSGTTSSVTSSSSTSTSKSSLMSSSSSSVASTSSSSSSAASYVFGLDADGVMYHVNGGQTGAWVYLCLNGDCRQATKNGNRYEYKFTINPTIRYNLQYKIQDNATSQCIADAANVLPGQGITASPCAGSSASSAVSTSSSSKSSVASSTSSSKSSSSAPAVCGDFGIAYSNTTNMTVYHKNLGWSAAWNYVCVDGDCRAGTLTNGYYRRTVFAVLGQNYSVEFKVEQAAAPGQYTTGAQSKTFTNQCVLP
jgi:hypothetical protein